MAKFSSLFIATIIVLINLAKSAENDEIINEEIKLVSFPPKFTNSTNAKFVFEINDNYTDGLQKQVLCQLNQGQTYICTPDIEYIELSNTRHFLTYTVNGSNVAYEYEWQIDTEAPKITLWNGPLNEFQTSNNNLSISVYVSDDTPVQLKCKLDTEEWYECWQPFIQIPKVKAGRHEFVIQAMDSAGNSAQETWSWETPQSSGGNLYASRRVLFPRQVAQSEGDKNVQTVDIELVGVLLGSASVQEEYVSSNTEMAFCFRIGKLKADEQNWKLQCSLDFGESIECGCGVKYQGLLPGRHIVQVHAYKEHSNQSTIHAQGERAWWVHPILCTHSSGDPNSYIRCGNLQPVPAAGAWMRVGGTLPQEVMMKLPYFRQELSAAFSLVSQDSVQVLATELVNSNETKIWMYLLQVDLTKEDKYQLVPLFGQVNLSKILTKSAYVQDAAVVEASKLVVPSTSDPPISQDLFEIQNGSNTNTYALQAYSQDSVNKNNDYNVDSVETQSQDSSSSSSAGLQSWVLALVVVCSLVVLLFFMLGGWRFWGQQKKAREADRYLREQMQQSDQDDISTQQLRLTLGNQVELFSYADVWKATDGFHTKNLLGEGGFGRVYKGQLNSAQVAVKRLDKDSLQGDKEFFMEVSTLSRMSHPNLVPIKGACVHGDIRICIMDLCVNGSLRDRLDQKKGVQMLDWKRRIQILTGAAKGLHHLHYGLNATVVHRDFKSQNVLLDENWNARVGDFGIAKVLRSENPNYATTGGIHGTLGYLAPEYRNLGAVTPKIDVFAFGVVIMEMLTSQNPYDSSRGNGKEALSEYFNQTFRNCDKSKLRDFLDVRIKDMDLDAAEVLCEVALSCTEFKDSSRSSMQEVLVRFQSLCQQYDIPQ